MSITEFENHLILSDFDKLFKDFIDVPTWTQLKYKKYELLSTYLDSCLSELIISSRDSKTTRVKKVDNFTIFKVSPNQRGIMSQFTNQWVLMYVKSRHKFQHYLRIFPLNTDFSKEDNIHFLDRYPQHYVSTCTTF